MKENLISKQTLQHVNANLSDGEAKGSNFRVAVMQRMICHYQMPFFYKLKQDLENINIDIIIFCGLTESQEYPNDDNLFKRLPHIKFNLNIGGLQEKLIILPSLFWSLIKYKPDIVIAEDISAMPNCLTIYLYCKLYGIPYIVWGPGSIPNKQPSKIRWFMEPLINFFRKGSKSFLCYSSYARDYYFTRYKKDCHIIYNSTTLPHSESEISIIKSSIRKKYHKLSRLNIVFIGKLIPQKRVDILLTAISKIDTDIPVSVNIIGDGNMKDDLLRLSSDLNIRTKINFSGAILDRSKKADIFMNSHLGILPGLGGLAIQEMMWYGVPVITSYADGTEQDLIINGVSGFFIEDMTAENLYKGITSFITLQNDKKIAIAFNGLKIINKKYNIQSMVKTFETSITSINNPS